MAKLRAVGNYDRCRFFADAKAVRMGAPVDYAKCDANFAAAWTAAETRIGCPTIGVDTVIQGSVIQHTSDLASLIAGANTRGYALAVTGGWLSDDGYDGSLPPAGTPYPTSPTAAPKLSMTCVDINMGPPPSGSDRVLGVEVAVDMAHTAIGDVTIKLVSPANTVVTLMSRPGFLENADDGSGTSSETADLAPPFFITFQQSALTSAENMGLPIGATGIDSYVVCQGDSMFPGICSYAPDHGAAAPGDLTSFNGELGTGTWRVCAGDSSLGETGYIADVLLTITTY